MNFPLDNCPKVTVIMPVYNAEKYLREAVDSILSQTFSDFEFLILNDGSTDHSIDILNSYDDSRILIHSSDVNKGLIYQLNLGLNLSRGTYIARMDADDISLQDRFERQIAYLDNHPEVAVLGGTMQSMTEDGLNCSLYRASINAEEIARKGDLAHPTVMIRSDAIKAVKGYRNAFVAAEDYDLWLRLGENYILANLEDVLIRYRIHSNQISVMRSCQQALSALGASFAAESRRLTGNDPTEKVSIISAESLIGIGVPQEQIELALMRMPMQEVNKLLLLNSMDSARKLLFEIDHLLCFIKSTKLARSRIAWSMSKTFSFKHHTLSKLKWMIRTFYLSPLKAIDMTVVLLQKLR
jgi:hypothetical protein